MQIYLTIFNIIFTFENQSVTSYLSELGDIEREEEPKLLFNRKVPGYRAARAGELTFVKTLVIELFMSR